MATFVALEKGANTMLEQWQRGPPLVYKYVWHKQLLRADKALWLKAAEDTWSNVQSNGGAKPVYEAIQRWSVHPEFNTT